MGHDEGELRARALSSRRQFLTWGLRVGAGALGLGAAGAVGYEWRPGTKTEVATPEATAPSPSLFSPTSPENDLAQVYRFYTRPDLQPPRVLTARTSAMPPAGPGRRAWALLTPKGYGGSGPGQAGVMMVDPDGRLRWFLPTQKDPFDLQYQQLHGKPVLTWWEGEVANGTGAGEAVIADMSLREVRRIGKVGPFAPDLHELSLTSEGTALLTAYQPAPADLSSLGGPRNGYVLASIAMEVDVGTGKLVRSWNSLEHVPVGETYQALTGGTKDQPFDYFHINSVATTPDGNLLISGRNTWAVYKVDRRSGQIIWRLNGKRSDFAMAPAARFFWQHHARFHGSGRLTLFDDGASPPKEPESRGLLLAVDEGRKACRLERAFVHPARLLAPNQGSMQVLPDGRVLIGWGAEPYFSAFSPEGEMLADWRLPTNVQSYRAFLAEVRTTPTDSPAVVVGANPPGGYTIYASWNGSTEVSAWQVLAGGTTRALVPVAKADWSNFETAVTVSVGGPYFQVVALDETGREIGRSSVVNAA